MNLRMGSQIFRDVKIPVLWGQRAIIQDAQGRLSVIDLSGERARIELLADEPAPGVEFRPRSDGLVILRDDVELYSYNRREKSISSTTLGLPDIEITSDGIRVGMNRLSGNLFSGFDVGLAVRTDGISIGVRLPEGLARLETVLA